MKIAKIISTIGIIAMTVALANAFINGDGLAAIQRFINDPWGIVSLVDLYTGFTLFAGWIWYREANKTVAIVWIVLLMGLGFFTGALYALVALFQSKNNWYTFWLGANAPKI
jgi:hypothetical protein